MHIILGILAAIASLMFYLKWAAKGANEAIDVANEVRNLPRKMKYRKKAGKRGLDLVEGPIEAATILMISIARMDDLGRVSETQSREISNALVDEMQLDREYADDLIVQMRSLSQYLTQPDSTLFPMIKILQNSIGKDDARELSVMLRRIAGVDSPIDADQDNFVRRFEERMGLMG